MHETIVVLHGAFTLAMVGVMSAVQFVIYPALRDMNPAALQTHAPHHANRMVRLLAPFAPAEVGLALWMWLDPAVAVNRGIVFVAGLLLALGWLLTGAWFAPAHGRLQTSGEVALAAEITRRNWARTAIWWVRGVLAIIFMVQVV